MRPAAARAAAAQLLDQVSLADAAGKRVDELSGGMAQRPMIARAIMHRPEVLFLDEPTTGLDPQSRLAVHGIITGLQAAGQTIMLIIHDVTEADALAGRVAIIDHGRLLALDTPAGLKRSVRGGTVVTAAAPPQPPGRLPPSWPPPPASSCGRQPASSSAASSTDNWAGNPTMRDLQPAADSASRITRSRLPPASRPQSASLQPRSSSAANRAGKQDTSDRPSGNWSVPSKSLPIPR